MAENKLDQESPYTFVQSRPIQSKVNLPRMRKLLKKANSLQEALHKYAEETDRMSGIDDDQLVIILNTLSQEIRQRTDAIANSLKKS